MFVRANVQRHVVIIDRIADLPIPARVAVAQILLAQKPPVGNIHQVVRHGDVHLHILDFIALLIFVRPPDARANAFARGRNPMPARRVFAKADAAEAPRLLRRTGVIKLNRLHRTLLERLRKIHIHRPQFARVFQFRFAVQNFVYLQVGKQVELNARICLSAS